MGGRNVSTSHLFYLKCNFCTLVLCEVQKMKEKKYEKRLDFQQKMISNKSEEIEMLKAKIEKLEEKCKEKDEIINSVEPLRAELKESVERHKNLVREYEDYIKELKQMKEIINQTVYKGRWKIIKLLIK